MLAWSQNLEEDNLKDPLVDKKLFGKYNFLESKKYVLLSSLLIKKLKKVRFFKKFYFPQIVRRYLSISLGKKRKHLIFIFSQTTISIF